MTQSPNDADADVAAIKTALFSMSHTYIIHDFLIFMDGTTLTMMVSTPPFLACFNVFNTRPVLCTLKYVD